ncbi:hypothetical protein [Haloarchaeobius sp. DFWS5]|uniref:hypothetical protein n=1 Tax=Haloarchaeobius sp. DFWS5 TaxID=3446114 RepID=UPI003EC0EA32
MDINVLGLPEGFFTNILAPLTSALLLILVYFQYRIQKKEYQPDLDVPRVAHHLSVVEERKATRTESDIEPDEVLFEVSNLGSGTAKGVQIHSKVTPLYRGDDLESGGEDTSAENLPFLNSGPFRLDFPRCLPLDVFREDVYHSNWKDNAKATIPGGKTDIGYLIHLHVRKSDGQESLNEILGEEYPEKVVFRLQLKLVYKGPLSPRISPFKYTDEILDFVIYPGVCSTLQEAMEIGVPYSRYNDLDRDKAILDAHVDLEKLESN